MNYPQPTQEQHRQIKNLFNGYGGGNFEMDLCAHTDGYRLRVNQMYEYIGFRRGISFLSGVKAIADILDCDETDEAWRQSSGGCETCDYGSDYEIVWKFWKSDKKLGVN